MLRHSSRIPMTFVFFMEYRIGNPILNPKTVVFDLSPLTTYLRGTSYRRIASSKQNNKCLLFLEIDVVLRTTCARNSQNPNFVFISKTQKLPVPGTILRYRTQVHRMARTGITGTITITTTIKCKVHFIFNPGPPFRFKRTP